MKFFLFISLFFSLEAHSSTLKTNFLNFLTQKNISPNTLLNSGPICQPDQTSQTSCVETACKKLGPFDCDSLDEIQKVSKACSNNFSGDCIDFSCSKLGPFDCDDLNEVEKVAQSCSYVYGKSCISELFNRLSSKFDYDDIQEIVKFNSLCKEATIDTVSCIKFSCDKMGKFACDSYSELSSIMSACK